MPLIKLPGVKAYVSKGKVYAYHRAAGQRLTKPYGSPEFFIELAAIRARHAQADTTAKQLPGTWGALVAEYRGNPKFLEELKPRTRKDYNVVLDWLANLDPMPLRQWSRGFVTGLRDKAHKKKGRRFANYVLAVVSVVFSYGFERELVDHHPAQRIKKVRRPREMARANRPWRNEEWEVVVSAAAPHLLAPILLCGVLGWREGEAISRPRIDYDRELRSIGRVSSKNGKWVATKTPRIVADAIEALFPHDATTLLVNSRKVPWTQSGFRASFFRMMRDLEQLGVVADGLTIHGLRHTCATRLREMGYDLRTIADMLGQETEGMAGHYANEADLKGKLDGVIDRLDKELG
jgi:integrase